MPPKRFIARLASALWLLVTIGAAAAAETGTTLDLELAINRLPAAQRGSGLVARYPAPGPGAIAAHWRAAAADGGFRVLRVVDPDGATVAATLIGPDDGEVELALPPGPEGAWRIICSGGADGDRIRLSLPPPTAWGISAELPMTWGPDLPDRLHLWLPERSDRLIVEQHAGSSIAVVAGDGAPLGRLPPGGERRLLDLALPTEREPIIAFERSGGEVVIRLDGAPPLLCPSAADAAALRGATVTADGITYAGPIQARMHRWMRIAAPEVGPASVDFAPLAQAEQPELALLLLGRSGPLSSLAAAAGQQCLDPDDPQLGSQRSGKPTPWQHFRYGPIRSPFDASGYVAATAEIPSNPCRDDDDLVVRAALSAGYHVVASSAEGALRELDLAATPNPIKHAFFTYDGALAQPYLLLQDRLPPEAAAAWRDGLVLVGDRLADFEAWATNQWAHVIAGHWHTWRATRLPRFRRYAETALTRLLMKAEGGPGRFGQHPTGYYLEHGGADGNYDHLTAFVLVSLLHEMEEEPDADAWLVAALRRAIARNLAFKSLLWLPRPNGQLISPNAFNCRTDHLLAIPTWPGDYISRSDFPLGLARWSANPEPESGIGPAGIYPYLANTPAWQRLALATLTAAGSGPSPAGHTGGHWLPALLAAERRPQRHTAATIPARSADGIGWRLPGIAAWKHAGLYTVVFPGQRTAGDQVPAGLHGGGPCALWHHEAGPVIASMRNARKGRVTTPDDLTHSCIYDRADPAQRWSGREAGTLHLPVDGLGAEVVSAVAGGGELRWRYRCPEGGLQLQVELVGTSWREPVLSLPILIDKADPELEEGADALRFRVGDSVIELVHGSADAELGAPVKAAKATLRCLRIPLVEDGGTWSAELLVRATTAP